MATDVFPPPPRLLLGPGPSQVHPRVLKALSTPLVGHMDPAFIALMEETKTLLRQVFQTTNELTIPISGTGTAGLEACIVNLVEPGDEVVIGVNGVFGTRLVEVASRAGATVVKDTWTNEHDGKELCKMAIILDPEGHMLMLHQMATWRAEGEG